MRDLPPLEILLGQGVIVKMRLGNGAISRVIRLGKQDLERVACDQEVAADPAHI
jgi:hypothetical protein